MAVQQGFHGGGAIPGVNGCGEYDAVCGDNCIHNLWHIVIQHATKSISHILAGKAAITGFDFFVGKKDIINLITAIL